LGGFSQDTGGHLVGEAAELIMDLDLDVGEAGGILGQPAHPLLGEGVELGSEGGGEIRRGGNPLAGLGLGADLHESSR
jgi:hypothetical protein